jgi:hypothetical protein
MSRGDFAGPKQSEEKTMEKATYTPGPWRAEGWKNVVVNLPTGETIALCPGPKYAPLGVFQANAALIAAAPDLLEALEKLADMVPEIARALPSGVPLAYADAFDNARAALTKARGEVAR